MNRIRRVFVNRRIVAAKFNNGESLLVNVFAYVALLNEVQIWGDVNIHSVISKRVLNRNKTF